MPYHNTGREFYLLLIRNNPGGVRGAIGKKPGVTNQKRPVKGRWQINATRYGAQ